MSVRLSIWDKKRAEAEAFVAPHLRPGEDIVAGIGAAGGPLHPLTPLIPLFGWIAACTPRYRGWSVVVTTERVFLVERAAMQPGRPRKIALEGPLADVAVTSWRPGTSSGLLRLKFGEQAVRIYVLGASMDDVPVVQAVLTRGYARLGAESVDLPPVASLLTPTRETDTFPNPAPTLPASSAAVRMSPIFVAIYMAFASFGVVLWLSHSLNRVAIFAFVVSGWIVSLCLHEFAHAYAAYRCGDHSVAARGYLTLNPARYSHPITSIAMPLMFLVLGGIGLPGGAVYIDKTALRTRRSASLVAAAGPLTNLALAFVLFAPFHFAGSALAHHPHFQHACAALAVLELVAAFLNLLPIPPLDGWGIIEPLFTGPGESRRRPHPAVIPLLLFVLVVPGGPGATLWHSAYRVGYGMGVPHGVAGDGLQLARFWTDAPPPRDPYARPRKQTYAFPMKSSPTPPGPAYTVPVPVPTTRPYFPQLEVTPGALVTTYSHNKHVFEIRGTGSQSTQPLGFSATWLDVSVDNLDGWVNVSIVPAGPRAGGGPVQVYVNDAGGGDTTATLPRPGTYVVRVYTIDPDVRWTMYIDDRSTTQP